MKKRILETARKLFNTNGIKPVTARMICSELSISPGSFSYHYPNKDVIIETLSSELLADYDQLFSELQGEDVSISDFLKILEELFNLQHRSRFFYLNLFEIITQHQTTKEAYKIHIKRNNDIIQVMLTKFQQSKKIKKDTPSKDIYNLGQLFQMLLNHWLTNSEINEIDTKKEKIRHHLKTSAPLITPYLTKEGLKEYKSYFK